MTLLFFEVCVCAPSLDIDYCWLLSILDANGLAPKPSPSGASAHEFILFLRRWACGIIVCFFCWFDASSLKFSIC